MSSKGVVNQRSGEVGMRFCKELSTQLEVHERTKPFETIERMVEKLRNCDAMEMQSFAMEMHR